MELRPLRNKREHAGALKEAESLWNAREGTPEEDRLLVLELLIEACEREHFQILDLPANVLIQGYKLRKAA